MHAVYDQGLLDGIFGDHLVESVVKLVNGFGIRLELQIFIKTVLENQRIFRSHGVIGFSGILFDIEEVVDNSDRLSALPDHEKDGGHEANLMPQEGIPYKMKVINLVSVIQSHPCFLLLFRLVLDLNYICPQDLPFEVDSIAQVHFAKVYEVVFPLEGFYCLLHGCDVQVVFYEKVLVRSLFTPVSSVKVLLNWFTCQNTNVVW